MGRRKTIRSRRLRRLESVTLRCGFGEREGKLSCDRETFWEARGFLALCLKAGVRHTGDKVSMLSTTVEV